MSKLKVILKCEYCGRELKDLLNKPCENLVSNRLIPGHVIERVEVKSISEKNYNKRVK